jgi:hypothetical protein
MSKKNANQLNVKRAFGFVPENEAIQKMSTTISLKLNICSAA